MSAETKASQLREEYELYRRMLRSAIAAEGANSSMARLAQAMVEDVQEELKALTLQTAA